MEAQPQALHTVDVMKKKKKKKMMMMMMSLNLD